MHLGGHIAGLTQLTREFRFGPATARAMREGDHPRLGGSVDARPGGGVTTEDGADRHDATRSGGNHGAGSGTTTEEGAVELTPTIWRYASSLISAIGPPPPTPALATKIEAAQSGDGCLNDGIDLARIAHRERGMAPRQPRRARAPSRRRPCADAV